MNSASERIKEQARHLGFTKVGIAPAVASERDAERLRTWLGAGYHATMAWMERRREEREEPQRVLPGIRSIISVAINYYRDVQHAAEEGRGKISRYAWGDDYHDLVKKRLEQLITWMEEQFPGATHRSYVDTGPVMEKAWAERAGIGWIGKHTNVITREAGSWVFLGEVLTTLALEYDAPATDHCGTCTRCIDACPTDAIVAPYVLDARRCISYLTIEHRGPVDEELAAHFEGWIYGCDICQDVCPWNKKDAHPTNETAFAPRPGFEAPKLAEWKTMTTEEFNERFRKSPILRAKHQGLMRNIETVEKSDKEKNQDSQPFDSSR